jgi:hypothetical protein
MLVRSTISTTSMPTTLAKYLCKSKPMHVPKIVSSTLLSFHFYEGLSGNF